MLDLYEKALSLGADLPSKTYIASRFVFLSYYKGQCQYVHNACREREIITPATSTVAKVQGSESPFVFLSLTKITDVFEVLQDRDAYGESKAPAEPVKYKDLCHHDQFELQVCRPYGFTLDPGALNVAISRQQIGLFIFGKSHRFQRASSHDITPFDPQLIESIKDGKGLALVVTDLQHVIPIGCEAQSSVEEDSKDKIGRSRQLQRSPKVKMSKRERMLNSVTLHDSNEWVGVGPDAVRRFFPASASAAQAPDTAKASDNWDSAKASDSWDTAQRTDGTDTASAPADSQLQGHFSSK